MPTPSIDYYWRPGCPFCSRLESKLTKLQLPLAKHNIWDDPAAAEMVRSIANGNETVPTVVVGSHRMVNPSADQVLLALQTEAPELLPEDWTPPEPGRVSSFMTKVLRGG
ncbi:MAG: NrdH-redoxin [Acidimicrobiales bacterium]|nr:NrdH-redoxin [Acidimicrobiales bacterium]